MSTRGGRATTTSPLLAAAASDTTTSRLITAPSDKRAPASGREPRSEPRQEEGIMLTRGVRCSHQCISCDMHRLSAALRRLSARHDTTFLMPLPAATLMHSPVRLHPEAPSTRALTPHAHQRVAAAECKLEGETRARRPRARGLRDAAATRAGESSNEQGSPPESVAGAQKGPTEPTCRLSGTPTP